MNVPPPPTQTFKRALVPLIGSGRRRGALVLLLLLVTALLEAEGVFLAKLVESDRLSGLGSEPEIFTGNVIY